MSHVFKTNDMGVQTRGAARSNRQLVPAPGAPRAQSGVPQGAWKRLSAGPGAKGERLYGWVLAPLWRLQLTPEERRWEHYLLVRRSLDEKRELAYYVVYAPKARAQLARLAEVAGRRWEIEIGFEATKGECGLDHYEVRRWKGWYRHITLSLMAHAVLVALRVGEKKKMLRLRSHRIERARTAQVARTACVARCREHRPRAALVDVAQTSSIPSSAMPLPTKAMYSAYWTSTAVVLRGFCQGVQKCRLPIQLDAIAHNHGRPVEVCPS